MRDRPIDCDCADSGRLRRGLTATCWLVVISDRSADRQRQRAPLTVIAAAAGAGALLHHLVLETDGLQIGGQGDALDVAIVELVHHMIPGARHEPHHRWEQG